MRRILADRGAIVMATLYAVLATTYSLVTPVFEASDEISHYPVVEHIATTGQLPVQRPGVKTLWEQEGSQPPLYYLLAATLTFWIDTGDLEQIQWRNPHAKLGIPLDSDNKNMIIHTEAERFPWRRTALAVHLIRFFSVALGTGTVLLTYRLAQEVFPGASWGAVLASAFVALNPMFLFISGSVNNDNLIVLLSTACILLSVRILNHGITPGRTGMLAVLASLASVTKISGLTLIPFIGLALLLRGWRHGEWRRALFAAFAVAAAWLTLAGWWYLRNVALYGEPLGLNTHVAIAGTRSIDLITLLTTEWYAFWVSYWALFGAVNILASGQVYFFYALLSLVAVIGLTLWARREIRARRWAYLLIPGLLTLQILIVLVGVIRWTMTTYASQGRLVFPVIAPISTLMAFGIVQMESAEWHKHVVLASVIFLALIAGTAPFLYIAPTYATPPTVTMIPETATSIHAQFAGLELVAAKTHSVTVSAGELVPITLYWRTEAPLAENYSIYLHALGRDNEEIGKVDSYLGGGLLPTSHLQPNTIIRDEYWLELDPIFEAPTSVRIQVGVGLYSEEVYEVILPVLPDGQSPTSITLDAGVAYPADGCERFVEDEEALATFADFAVMWGPGIPATAQPGNTIEVSLIWDRRADTTTDWTVFVQMVDETGIIVEQADGPPVQGYYPTSLWRMPCQVEDTHVLQVPPDLPPGTYQILVGLYDASNPSFARIPAMDATGSPYPNDAVSLGTVRVEAP